MVTTTSAQARRRRDLAARRYKPQQVQLLLVAQAPPCSLDRYFYFEDVTKYDDLFRYVARGILRKEPSRTNKASLLAALQDKGVFLIDVRQDPADSSPLRRHVPLLIRRIRRLNPARIILIKTDVYDKTYKPLAAAGLPVVNERIPFPGNGWQRKFVSAFARALKKKPLTG